MAAAGVRYGAAAANIANARSAGAPSGAGGEAAGLPRAYQPVRVEQTAEPGGGVRAVTLPVEPATVPVFDPDNPLAGEDGSVAYPNVSLAAELVAAKSAAQA